MTAPLTDDDLARIEADLAMREDTLTLEVLRPVFAALREARAGKDRGYAARVKALEEVAEAARDYAPISSEHRGEGQENCMNLSCTLLRALAALDAVRAKATP